MQVDQVWKGNGQESHALEILSYDPVRKTHTSSGFSDDGSTWNLTASFHDNTVSEESLSKNPEGQPTTCHTTFVFSAERSSLSGTQECEENGRRWTAFRVKGDRFRKKLRGFCKSREAKLFRRNGGDDETRTRDLCRDRAAF
jgi:hypothetical protein